MTRSKKVWAENIAEKFKKDVLGEKYDGLPQRSGLPKRLFEQLRSYSISLDLNGDLYICYPRMVEFPTNPLVILVLLKMEKVNLFYLFLIVMGLIHENFILLMVLEPILLQDS